MYRHPLLAILIVLMLAPSIARAQAPEPVGTVSATENEVARAYDNPDVLFDATIGIIALGSVHASEAEASRTANVVASTFSAALTSELAADDTIAADFTFGELETVPVEPPLGDESIADRMPFTVFGEFEGEYVFLTVRQGTWVQVLVGFGAGEVDVLTDLESVATTLLPRWPTTDPITVRTDGLRTGGIWNMTPMPEDVPSGFELDETFEEGPAATSGAAAPVATPVAGAESPRDLPLIPTPTPEGSAPLPTSVPQTPGVVPTAVPMNPRLAAPFDVTIEIILPLDTATIGDDGSCSGTGLFDGLTAGESLTLRSAGDSSISVSAPIAAPGMVTYDTLQEADVCYLVATFTDVPARSAYTLLAGESVLGRYSYEELSAGDPVLIEPAGD